MLLIWVSYGPCDIWKFNSDAGGNLALRSITRWLSLSSSSIGIEVLEIGITWHRTEVEPGRNLFLSDALWSTLDQLLTSQMFVSLRKIILSLEFSRRRSRRRRNESLQQHIMELERNQTLLCVNELFPLFRADTQHTLEPHLKFTWSLCWFLLV